MADLEVSTCLLKRGVANFSHRGCLLSKAFYPLYLSHAATGSERNLSTVLGHAAQAAEWKGAFSELQSSQASLSQEHAGGAWCMLVSEQFGMDKSQILHLT